MNELPRRARHDETAGPAAVRRARRQRRARRGIVAGAVAGSLAIAGVAVAATRDPGPRYRTATASTAAVEQTIEAVGTVASATRVDASFSVAGTVGTVDVSVGDVVAAGDVLATLDLTALQDALEEAESAVADAQQQLEDDLEAQTSASASSSTSSASSTPSPTPDPSTGSPGGEASGDPATAAAVAAVAAAQRTLLAQYDVASAALAASRASLTASQLACEPFLDLGSDPAMDPLADPATDPLTDPATTEALVGCQDALDLVLAEQSAVEAAQATLLDLATALDRAVGEAQRALVAAAGSPSSSSATAATSSSSSASAQSSTPTSATPSAASTKVPSAEDILADRAAIDAAVARAEIARAALGMATLTSPVPGTVGAISIAPGDTVTASSSTAVVTVLGDTGHAVTMTIALSVIDTVAVGQPAKTTVASTDQVLTGAVSSIGILDVSTSSTPAYTVVVTLDPTDERLFDGASARVTITVSGNEATLTVPTSAVHVDGTAKTVTVLRDGEPVVVDVETGAVGDERTEILSGLAAGDEVVLADLSKPLTEDEGTNTTGLSGLGGDSEEAPDMVRGSVPGGMVPPSFDRNGG